jgi:hypothetical protein
MRKMKFISNIEVTKRLTFQNEESSPVPIKSRKDITDFL